MTLQPSVSLVAVCAALVGCASAGGAGADTPARTSSVALQPGDADSVFGAQRIRDHVMLTVDGRIYATNGDDMPTILGAAVYPMLAAPERSSRRCAVVGIGSGIEASTMAELGCDRIDVFESRDGAVDNLRAWDGGLVAPELLSGSGPFRRLAEPPEGVRYDVIVQSVGSTAIEAVDRLFSVARFERLRGLLTEGGVFLQHVQLYEIEPAAHRRLMRTLAEVFDHLMVFAPEPLSSDSLVLASEAPLQLHLDRLGAWAGYERWTDWMEPVTWFDPMADLLFANRAEVMRYVGDAAPISGANPMTPLALRPPLPELRVDGAFDMDRLDAHSAAVEAFQSRFDPEFLASFHRADRPEGEPCPGMTLDACPAVVPAASDEVPPEAEYALSLIGNGWYARAADRIEANPAAAPAARYLLALLAPAEHAPAGDPLSPFPESLDAELESAWAARHETPERALAALRAQHVREEPLRSRLAFAELLLAGPEGEVEPLVDHLEDSTWCLQDSPACLYWLAVTEEFDRRKSVRYLRSVFFMLDQAETPE